MSYFGQYKGIIWVRGPVYVGGDGRTVFWEGGQGAQGGQGGQVYECFVVWAD